MEIITYHSLNWSIVLLLLLMNTEVGPWSNCKPCNRTSIRVEIISSSFKGQSKDLRRRAKECHKGLASFLNHSSSGYLAHETDLDKDQLSASRATPDAFETFFRMSFSSTSSSLRALMRTWQPYRTKKIVLVISQSNFVLWNKGHSLEAAWPNRSLTRLQIVASANFGLSNVPWSQFKLSTIVQWHQLCYN